jgi:FtsZ-binding cell division protein ZapB
MTDFFEVLNIKHKQAIKTIKHLIDVEVQEYPEYKQAATLCKFLFDSEDRYAMIEKADAFKGFYDNAQDFETLCHCIYHALTDDGDIAFVQLNNHCPVIVFESRWELKIDDLISKDEQALYERLNSFKKEKGILPLHEHKMAFLDNVYEYIQAVKQYRIDSEIQRKSVGEKLRMFKDKKNNV